MEHIAATDIISVGLYGQESVISTTWSTCTNAEEFVSGIKSFHEIFWKVKPAHTLWHNQNCEFYITPELQAWTDSFLNLDAVNKGFNGKVAVIVGDNMKHLLSLANLFEEGQADLNSRFFLHPAEAMNWLNRKARPAAAPRPTITVKKLDDMRSSISLEIDSEALNEYIFLLNRLLKSSEFKISHAAQFQALSSREKEVFQLIVKGFTNPMIAKRLFISIDTVKTHRKNIMQKLRCRNIQELLKYAVFVKP
jgi:DNA-binding CsgD family transcriptional regulator